MIYSIVKLISYKDPSKYLINKEEVFRINRRIDKKFQLEEINQMIFGDYYKIIINS